MRALALLFVGACGTAGAPSSNPTGTHPPAPGSAAQPVDAAQEVTPTVEEVTIASEQTRVGGRVIAIGKPRLRVADAHGELVLRVGKHRVYGVDGGVLVEWDLATGAVARRTAVPRPKGYAVDVQASADGDRVAAGTFAALGVYEDLGASPLATISHASPLRFSSDAGRLVVETGFGIGMVSVADGKLASQPPKPTKRVARTFDAVVRGDDVYWVNDIGVLRWNTAKPSLDVVVDAALPWRRARVADRGPVAIAIDDSSMYRIDLDQGTSTKLGPASYFFDVSPRGNRLALANHAALEVIDLVAAKRLATYTLASDITRIAFGETDDVLAVGDANGRISVVDVTGGVRSFGDPVRFAGWLADGAVALDQGGALSRLDPVTLQRAPLASAGPRPTPGYGIAVGETQVIIVDAAGTAVARFDRGAEAGTYTAAAISADGRSVALSWQRDAEAFGEVWELPRDKGKRKRLWQQAMPPTALATFTHDGQRVLFGLRDGGIEIRDVTTGAERIERLHDVTVTTIDVSPDDRYVLSEDGAGEQRLWPL